MSGIGVRLGGGSKPGVKRGKYNKAPKDKVTLPATEMARTDVKDPLEYMLSVMRDPEVSVDRRDRMAIAAAPFIHARKEAVGAGKKEEKAEAAAKAATGIFAPAAPPALN